MNANSLKIEKMESRAGINDLTSNNDSFNLHNKSPTLNLMITPSVHDFPHRGGKIKTGDFDNYIIDGESDSKHFAFNSVREPLRKEADASDQNFLKPPVGQFNDAMSPQIAKEPATSIEDKQTLRSKSNAARLPDDAGVRNNCGQIVSGSASAVGRSGSFAPNALQNMAPNTLTPVMTPRSAMGRTKLLGSQAQMSTGKFGNRALYSMSPGLGDQNPNKAIQCLQEQVQKLQKQLQTKEADYNRDKAIWNQKSDLADRALEDMRRKAEIQKQQYIQMIKLSNSGDSPLKNAQNLFANQTQIKVMADLSNDEVQAEIKMKADALAEINMQDKLLNLEKTLKAQSQSEILQLKQAHEALIQEKNQMIKSLKDRVQMLESQLQESHIAQKQLVTDSDSTKSLLNAQKELYEATNSRSKSLLEKLNQCTKELEEAKASLKTNEEQWTKINLKTNFKLLTLLLIRQKKEQEFKKQLEQLELERDDLKDRLDKLMNKQAIDSSVQTEEQQNKEAHEDFESQIETLKQMLIDKDIQIEAHINKNERDRNNNQVELQKKDEIILCLTRELRFNQTIQESLELQHKADKAGLQSNSSHYQSDDKTDVSVGAGNQRNENADERSRKSKRNTNKIGGGIPIDKGKRGDKGNDKKQKPEVVIDEIDASRKDSMVSFKDSTVSKAFVTQSKKSAVMEPPSFSQDIIGQQVTALQHRQTFGKIPDEMKKCFQPESAGLPQLKKLGNTDEDYLRQLQIYQQLLQNAQKNREGQIDKLGTSAHFISQNFNDDTSNYNEVLPETHNDSSFRKREALVKHDGQSSSHEHSSKNSDAHETQEPIEISSQHLNESDKNDCSEIDVPVCERSQNEESYYNQTSQTNYEKECESTQSKQPSQAEIYFKKLQMLQQQVSSRCQVLSEQGELKTDQAHQKSVKNPYSEKDKFSQFKAQQQQQFVPIETITKNDDCYEYSESADVCRNRYNDLTSRQLAIQQQLEAQQPENQNSSSFLLSEGFGSSDLQSNLLLQDKSDFTRIIPKDLTVYTRSYVETASNIPSSAGLPISQNDSIQFHQNFPNQVAAQQLNDCGISEIAMSINNISVANQRHKMHPAQQLLEDQSLHQLIKEMNLDASYMSDQNFIHNSELLEKCMQKIENQRVNIQSQQNQDAQRYVQPQFAERKRSFQQSSIEETCEQVHDEFTMQSRQETVYDEFQQESEQNILCEESQQSVKRGKKTSMQKGYIFTFKKEDQNLLSVPKQQTLSDFKECCDFDNNNTSENLDQSNDSMDLDEPQIHHGNGNGSAARKMNQNYKQSPSSSKNGLRMTPRRGSKHKLNDTIEPRIVVDRSNINLPRKSPLKKRFPDPNGVGAKSSNGSRIHGGGFSSLGIGNDSELHSALPAHSQSQRQLLFKRKNQDGKQELVAQSLNSTGSARQVPTLKLPDSVSKQKLNRNSSKDRITDRKPSAIPTGKAAPATARSGTNDNQSRKQSKRRTPSQLPPVSDFQQVVVQQSAKQNVSVTQRNSSVKRQCKSVKQGLQSERLRSQNNEERRGFSGHRELSKNKDQVGGFDQRQIANRKLISDLVKDAQVMEKLTKMQNMNTNTSSGNQRKMWNTGCKQAPSPHQGSLNKNLKAQQPQIASNCLLQRRKDFKDAKMGGFRKFDLDSIDEFAQDADMQVKKLQ